LSYINQRLIVFGPSASYGLGLDNPDKEVWGRILSNNLNKEFINKSIPGASNKLISFKVTTYNFLPNDLVIISWAYPDRYTVIDSDKSYRNFMPSDIDERATAYYYHIHNEFDHLFMSTVYINYTINFLKKQNIEVYSLFDGVHWAKIFNAEESVIPIDYANYSTKYPRASDGVHVGKQGHRALGEALTKVFKKSAI